MWVFFKYKISELYFDCKHGLERSAYTRRSLFVYSYYSSTSEIWERLLHHEVNKEFKFSWSSPLYQARAINVNSRIPVHTKNKLIPLISCRSLKQISPSLNCDLMPSPFYTPPPFHSPSLSFPILSIRPLSLAFPVGELRTHAPPHSPRPHQLLKE